MPEKMKRKGQLEQGNDGTLMIVATEEKKGYKVDNTVAAVWVKSDNKTVDEVVDDMQQVVKDVDRSVIKEAVETIITDLKKVNLVV